MSIEEVELIPDEKEIPGLKEDGFTAEEVYLFISIKVLKSALIRYTL